MTSPTPDACPPGAGAGAAGPPTPLERALRVFSLVTMASTIPQVVAVWQHGAQGVSLISWLAYLISACLWLVYGLRKHDRTIYLPCIGWIALDAAVVAGIVARG